MLRPYLLKLTGSEFHALIVSGHATLAGFVFALFMMLGVSREKSYSIKHVQLVIKACKYKGACK